MGLDLPDGPDRKKPGGRPPNKPGGGGLPKFRMPAMPPGLGTGLKVAAGLANPVAAVATLGLGAYEASEYLKETDYGNKMADGAGKDAEKAFKNINADFSKLDITQQQAQDILNQPASPGKKRDLEAFGGEDALRKKAGLPSLEAKAEEPTPIVEQASLRKYDYIPEPTVIPETDDQARLRIDRENEDREEARIEAKYKQTRSVIPTLTPKKEETTGVDILNKVTDQRTDLKYDMDKPETRTMGVPIISKQTINNTEQTTMAATPVPHSNDNTFVKWQLNRSAYT
jgi:hypothetical protein